MINEFFETDKPIRYDWYKLNLLPGIINKNCALTSLFTLQDLFETDTTVDDKVASYINTVGHHNCKVVRKCIASLDAIDAIDRASWFYDLREQITNAIIH